MRQSLKKHGKSTSSIVEVVNLSLFGFWINVDGKELYLSFAKFPWFKKATLEQIFNISYENNKRFYWPDLDIDLDFDRIEHPEKYPLVSV